MKAVPIFSPLWLVVLACLTLMLALNISLPGRSMDNLFQASAKVSFSAFIYEIVERDTTFSVTVSLSKVNVLASVDYEVGGGSATPGIDYEPVSGTLYFSLDTTQSFDITIRDDTNIEIDETILLTLTNPIHCTLGNIPTATFRIKNGDVAMIRFAETAISRTESASVVNIEVQLTASSSQTVTVGYDMTNNLKSPSIDYIVMTTNTLTFAPGVTSVLSHVN